MLTMAADTELVTNRQRLLAEIRDKLCAGNSAQLAREIDKDATYVNRLFYPPEKPGHKGIGLEIMGACTRAFYLPAGFWDSPAPALDDQKLEVIHFMRELRSKVAHNAATPEERQFFDEYDGKSQANFQHTMERMRDWQRVRDDRHLRLSDAEERLCHYTGEPFAWREPRTSYGMEPILAWEHADDLPEGEFVMVPRLDVHLSAGGGREQVEIDLVKENPQAFRSEWIRLMRLKPNKLAAMRAAGDSMEPTIHDGDSLLVDTSQTTVQDGKVYALWYDGGERVKRLFRLPGGGLRIKSDNPQFDTIELAPTALEHVRIIGRVVHRSGVGGL